MNNELIEQLRMFRTLSAGAQDKCLRDAIAALSAPSSEEVERQIRTLRKFTKPIYRNAADLIERLDREKETIIKQLIETKEYYRSRLATEDQRIDRLQQRIAEMEDEVKRVRAWAEQEQKKCGEWMTLEQKAQAQIAGLEEIITNTNDMRAITQMPRIRGMK